MGELGKVGEIEMIIGYIVLDGDGAPLVPAVDQPGEPSVLWTEGRAYLFKRRRTANRAIDRSRKFAKDHGLAKTWEVDKFRVVPVVGE